MEDKKKGSKQVNYTPPDDVREFLDRFSVSEQLVITFALRWMRDLPKDQLDAAIVRLVMSDGAKTISKKNRLGTGQILSHSRSNLEQFCA